MNCKNKYSSCRYKIKMNNCLKLAHSILLASGGILLGYAMPLYALFPIILSLIVLLLQTREDILDVSSKSNDLDLFLIKEDLKQIKFQLNEVRLVYHILQQEFLKNHVNDDKQSS